MIHKRCSAGFGLTELMVAMVIVGIAMAGVASYFMAHKRVATQEELSQTLERNLRNGLRILTDSLRSAGYGAPKTGLATWVPWVSGFGANPLIIDNSGATPDTVSIARCTDQPVTTLDLDAGAAATTIRVVDSSGFNTSSRRLISIGLAENAHITAISGTTLTIDTVPGGSAQGLSAIRRAGTPICRVDVETYSVDPTSATLQRNGNDGTTAQVLLDGIVNMQVVRTGSLYQVTLTARSDQPDPATGALVTRSMLSAAAVKN